MVKLRKEMVTIGNIFGEFKSGMELLEHFTAIWGGEDGFFHAWRVWADAMDFLGEFELGEFPEVEAFAYSLYCALEDIPY